MASMSGSSAGLVEVELASAEPIDENLCILRRSGEQDLEFVAPLVELAAAGPDREGGFEAVGRCEPDPRLSEVQVQPIPVIWFS